MGPEAHSAMHEHGAPLDHLRQWLSGQEGLLRELGALFDPVAFASRMCEAARAAGIEAPMAEVIEALRPDPLGLSRWQAPPVNPQGWPGPGWFPARSLMTADSTGAPSVHIDWAWLGDRQFDLPFYEDTVRQSGSLPLSQFLRARTGLDALLAGWRAEPDPVVPAGLVFHLSRCGSTLLARMLQQWPGCYAASEPEPLDAIIQWASLAQLPDSEKVTLIRAMVAAIGRNRPSSEARFFIKLDCWHIVALPLLRAVFPDTPWIFLSRDPIEVAVSQLAMPGIQVVPGLLGSAILGIEGGEEMAQEEYIARVLGRICHAAADHGAGDGGMFVDYRDLSVAMRDAIPAHFGLAADDGTAALLDSLTAVSAKEPAKRFSPDSENKRSAASSLLKEQVLMHATPWYQKLMM